MLWGDRPVARFDSRFDKATSTFVVLGFWLEDKALARNSAFAEALALSFKRFAAFLGAAKTDFKAIREAPLRKACVNA